MVWFLGPPCTVTSETFKSSNVIGIKNANLCSLADDFRVDDVSWKLLLRGDALAPK